MARRRAHIAKLLATLEAAANMTDLAAFRITLEGGFEDGFLYMGSLLAVREDRTLVQADLANLIAKAFSDPARFLLAEMFLMRNDYLEQYGAARMLAVPEINAQIGTIATEAQIEVPDDEWSETDDFSKVLPDGDVLDLQVYNRRLFVATTKGMLHSDLMDDFHSIRLNRAVKRTDARCLAITARSGSVVASCGEDGLLINYDEFNELERPVKHKELHEDIRSLRASWLGFNLINYSGPASAESFRSKYDRQDKFTTVITSMKRDDELLVEETSEWSKLTFSFNDYNTFFTRSEDGSFTVRRRRWKAGRLGKTESAYRGVIDQPISVHTCRSGLVVETFDRVYLVTPDGLTTIHEGQAIAVRTFPNSRHYRNLTLIVADDELHLVSPVPEAAAGGRIN